MDSTPAVSRLRLSRFSQYSQRSGTDSQYLAPQAGPSRLSSHMDALDVPYSDDDEQATPRVSNRPQLSSAFDATPSQTTQETGAERLRKVMHAMGQDRSSTRRPSPPRRPENVSEIESDFESPHATVSESVHVQKFKDLFSKVHSEWTPPKKRSGHRRNSIDSSEVEDSPRVERVQQEREQLKGKRRIVSDEEAEVHPRSSEASEPSRYTSASAARMNALQDRLANSLRSSVASQEPTRSTAFAMGNVMSGAEELMQLEPPTVLDASGETSGETAKMFRHMEREPSMSGAPVASSTPMRSVQMPSHFESQSNLLGEDSNMQKAMQGLDSEGESYVGQRSRLPFPGARPNARETSPDAAARAHIKSHTAHKIPIPRRVSGGRESVTSSRSSSISASDFQDRYRADEQDKRYERERLWNKPNGGKSPGRTPESARRVSGGSPSFNTTIRPGDTGSPGRNVSRRASMTSLRSYGSRSSLGSSMSSNADDRERIAEFDDEKRREREQNWNKARPRRASSSQSIGSPNDRPRIHGTPPRPGSGQAYNFINGRPISWASPGRINNLARAESPDPSAVQDGREEFHNPVVQERERNWNSPHPQWVYQVPRSLSPLPPSPPVPGSGYGRPPADWDPNRLESPSRVRHTSLVNGRRVSGERSRTSSFNQEAAPSKSLLHRASSAELQGRRSQSPVLSETTEDDRIREASSRFGWAMPKRRANLPPFQADVDTPQKRPSTPESRPSSRLGTRPSLIPIRSPGRKDDPPPRPEKNGDVFERRRDKGKQRDVGDEPFPESRFQPSQRSRIEPVDLINAPTEELAPTDIESGSDRESQVTSTPQARPSTLPPPEAGPSGSRRSPSPPSTASPEQNHSSVFPDSFVTAASPSSPQLSPVRERSPEPPFGLSTPPRNPQNLSKFEFETPSPPRDMPELPAPPSSSEDEFDRQATPIRERRSLLADFTAVKTPRPPGAWAPTPVPAEKPERPDMGLPPAPALPPEAETPTQAAPAEPSVVAPTPAPPGAWQPTPSNSMRRKSILKVRFENDTSGESMPEVPMIGPGTGDPAVDSMSEMFPPLTPLPPKEQPVPPPPPAPVLRDEPRAEQRPSTPPTVRPRRFKSPSMKLVDPYGNEIEELPEPPAPESMQGAEGAQDVPPAESLPALRAMRAIMVDPMGREVKSEEEDASLVMQPAKIWDDEHNGRPMTRRESITRLREAVRQMAEDFGESDDSRIVSRRDDTRLDELYRKSQAAQNARKDLVENLKKRQSDPNIQAKDWLPREAVSRGRLMQGRGLFAVDFLNTWVLWTFVVLQILILIYMYHLSTIRAKQIFLTTYYDAFTPDLFSHISKNHLLRNAVPPSSSPSATPFNITDALTRDGWRGVVQEAYTRATVLVVEWQNHVWDNWGQHPGRTAWPPT